MELTQPLLIEAIPDVDKPIRAPCGECVVEVVEGNGIDGINMLNPIHLGEEDTAIDTTSIMIQNIQ